MNYLPRTTSRILVALLFCLCASTVFALDLPSNRDPKYNSSINPKYNSSINPKYNASLNPTYNSSIDPTKSAWSGLYTFDEDGDLSGVAVRAERGFLLLFGLNGKWQGYFASNSESGFNWFSVDGEWRGYCVHNSEKGFNIYTKDGEWIGFMN